MQNEDVVLLAQDGDLTRIVFHALDEASGIDEVILEDPEPLPHFLGRRVRRLGMGTVLGQILFVALCEPVVRWTSRTRIREILEDEDFSTAQIPTDRVRRVPSVNGEATIERLRDIDPAIVVVNGTRIIDTDVLDGIDSVFLNLHTGITPAYRGVHGGYWALRVGEPSRCGVTVHRIDPGIDTGPVVGQAKVEPMDRDTFATIPYLQVAAGLPMLRQAVHDALAGKLETQDIDGDSNLWSHPTFLGYLRGVLEHGVR